MLINSKRYSIYSILILCYNIVQNILCNLLAENFKQQLTSLDFTENLIKRRMLLLANQPEIIIMKQVILTFSLTL